jgi:DNA-directed RNA polymerase subunit E'/Rpb7
MDVTTLSAGSEFSTAVLEKNIILPMTSVGKNIIEILMNAISLQIEGKCISEGYVKPGSSKLISYSAGLIERGNKISFHVVFSCGVCCPIINSQIQCKIVSITNSGIRAESVDTVPTCMVIYISRDLNSKDFHDTEFVEGKIISVKVIGKRFELNDAFVSVIAKIDNYKRKKQPQLQSFDELAHVHKRTKEFEFA